MTERSRLPALSLSAPHQGFVLAMRAKLTMESRTPWHEWMVVSRWGDAGQFLAIGRTFVPAVHKQPAPIKLTPQETILATLLPLPPRTGGSTYLLLQTMPTDLTVAGDFVSAHGFVVLRSSLQLHAEGYHVKDGVGGALRCEATRVEWVGEYIESLPVEGT